MGEELELMKIALSAIPQWYEAETGLNKYKFKINSKKLNYYSHRTKTPHLSSLTTFIKDNFTDWMSIKEHFSSTSFEGKVQRDIAIEWLKINESGIDWDELISYIEKVRLDTYENNSITLNLIITEGSGGVKISVNNIQKVFAPLAVGTQTYIKLDRNLLILSLEEIMWADINDTESYKYNPEFLQPFASILEQNQFSVHLTSKGDIIVMNKEGVLVSCRKDSWHIYDMPTFKNSLHDIIGHYRVACGLLETILDLSYKRHGALLIYDPDESVISQVINKESVMLTSHATPDTGRDVLMSSVSNIAMGSNDFRLRKKRLFLEIASLDGAVIFHSSNVLSFGSMVNTHPGSGGLFGARSTAALSTYYYGGYPIKISSDGDVSIIFKSSNSTGASCQATINFM